MSSFKGNEYTWLRVYKTFLCSAIFSKKEFAVVSNLRFISRTNFMLSRVEHEKALEQGLGPVVQS